MFHTSSFLRPYKDSEFPIDVNLRKQLYFQLEVKSNDSDLVMFIDSCKATPSIKPHAKPEYVFINGGYENRTTFYCVKSLEILQKLLGQLLCFSSILIRTFTVLTYSLTHALTYYLTKIDSHSLTLIHSLTRSFIHSE